MSEKLPKGWVKCKIKEIGTVITGTTPSKNNPEFWGNEILFITPSDYKNYNKWCWYSERKLSSRGKDNLIKKLLPSKSILVTCIGSDMGKVVINPFPVITNQQINSIIIGEKIAHYDFIYYLLLSMSEELKMLGHSGGSALPILNKSTFKNLEIEIPESLDEQRAIASVLSSLDDKIDLLHRQNKTLEAMAEALFRKWFIEEAKEDWEEVKLGDLVKIKSGKGLKKENFVENGLYSVLGSNGEIGKTNNYLFDEKLIYTGRVGTLGNVFISEGKAWLSDNTLVIKPSTDDLFYFVYFFLKSIRLEDLNVGSTQPLIRQTDLKEIEVVIPGEKFINNFYGFCEIIFSKIKQNQQQIRTLENLRDTLLPKLISGEARVKI